MKLLLALLFFTITAQAQNRPLKIYISADFNGKDMIEVAKFLEFILYYEPGLEP